MSYVVDFTNEAAAGLETSSVGTALAAGSGTRVSGPAITKRWGAIAVGLVLLIVSAIPSAGVVAQQATTVHMEVDGGPAPGTYDLTTQAPCTFGSLATGTWALDVVDAAAEPSSVHLSASESAPEYDSVSFAFGDPSSYSGPFYRSSTSHPIQVTVDDRGDSATLTLRADWLEAYAEDGTDMSGASAVVTVECRQVTRIGGDATSAPMPDRSPAALQDIDSLPPGTRIATGTVTWTLDETYDDPAVPESSHTLMTMVVEVALYLDEGRWLDAGSRFSITGTETRADRTTTDATGQTCTTTGYIRLYEGDESFSGSPWIGTEYQPMIELEVDPALGTALGAWGSAGTVATWTEVGPKCDPPGPREETGRLLMSIWCRTPEDRLRTLGSLSADGAVVDLGCSYSGSQSVNTSATIAEAVTVSGVVQLGTR